MVMITRPGLLIRVQVRVGGFLPLRYEYTLTKSMKDTEILVILNAFRYAIFPISELPSTLCEENLQLCTLE